MSSLERDSASPPPAGEPCLPRSVWWCGLVITLFTAAAFSPLASQSLTSFDDREFLAQNSMIQRGLTWEGVKWAFTTYFDHNYNPVAWLSIMLDVTLFGFDPANVGPQKLGNLAFHLLAMWALLLALVKATGRVWPSGAVAALFALHPLHVEAVAWTIERKGVLGVMFAFTAILAYVHYARRPSAARMGVVALLMALSTLSKATLVTLPFVLLLFDFWPLRRWDGLANPDTTGSQNPAFPLRRLILEKIPLLCISVAIGFTAIAARAARAPFESLDALPLTIRFTNAAMSYTRYLGKFIWPRDLCVFYGMTPWLWWQVAAATTLLLAITVVAIFLRKRAPWLIVGWLFYLGALLPMIGIVQTGPQSMADRYTYFSLTGILIALAWSVPPTWFTTARRRLAIGVASGALLAVLAFATHRQTAFWQNDVTLFTHAVEAEPNTGINLQHLTSALLDKNRPEDALGYTTRQIHLYPEFADGYAAHGAVLIKLNRLDEAEPILHRGIELKPRAWRCRFQLAFLLLKRGKTDEAITELETALRDRPDEVTIYRALTSVLLAQARFEKAQVVLRGLLTLNPLDIEALTSLGVTLDRLNKPQEAAAALERARALKPGDVNVRENLGAVYSHLGRINDAAAEYESILIQKNLKPETLVSAMESLGLLRGMQGRAVESIALLRRAAELAPVDGEVQNNLGVSLAKQNDMRGAAAAFEAAVKADPTRADFRANLDRAKSRLR